MRVEDLDRNGIMTRNETRYLFRLVNFAEAIGSLLTGAVCAWEELADQFHDAVDTNRSGEISLQALGRF